MWCQTPKHKGLPSTRLAVVLLLGFPPWCCCDAFVLAPCGAERVAVASCGKIDLAPFVVLVWSCCYETDAAWADYFPRRMHMTREFSRKDIDIYSVPPSHHSQEKKIEKGRHEKVFTCLADHNWPTTINTTTGTINRLERQLVLGFFRRAFQSQFSEKSTPRTLE